MRAVRQVAEEDAYAGLLVSMHTYNLLTERADRATIRQDQLPMLDDFLAAQLNYQHELLGRVRSDGAARAREKPFKTQKARHADL